MLTAEQGIFSSSNLGSDMGSFWFSFLVGGGKGYCGCEWMGNGDDLC